MPVEATLENSMTIHESLLRELGFEKTEWDESEPPPKYTIIDGRSPAQPGHVIVSEQNTPRFIRIAVAPGVDFEPSILVIDETNTSWSAVFSNDLDMEHAAEELTQHGFGPVFSQKKIQ